MYADRVEQTTLTVGTNSFALGTPPVGRRSYATAYTNGQRVPYVCETADESVWEIGTGILDTGNNTITRAPIRSSSGAATLASFPEGTKRIYVGLIADLARLPTAGSYPTAGGTATVLTVTLGTTSNPITALFDGMVVRFRAASAATGAATLNVDGRGALPMRKGDGSIAVAANDWLANDLIEVVYESASGGRWIFTPPGLLRSGAATAGQILTADGSGGVTWASNGMPVGTIYYVPANVAPAGALKANGALVSRTTYAALWAYAQASGNLAGTDGAWTAGQFSPGDGSTTFRLPDGRGEFVRGWDDGRGVDTGRTIGSAQSDDFRSHTHTLNSANDSTAGGLGLNYVTASNTTATAKSTNTTGGSETRPRNIAWLACIKF